MIYEETLGRFTLLQDTGRTRIGTDSLSLGTFLRIRPRGRVCDLGCGSGVLGLLALCAQPDCIVTGVELSPEDCALARETVRRNRLDGRFRVLEGDIRAISALLPAGQFDSVISNPPYFPAGPASPDPARARARREDSCSLDELCRAAAWLLRWGGDFALVHRPERLADLCCALRAHGLEPKRLQLVRHHAGAPVSLLLLEARRGGRPGLAFLPDLLLHDANGRETAPYRSLFSTTQEEP